MDAQETISDLLRRKGIGPEGSKSLNPSDLEAFNHCLLAQEASITTKATLLTALLILDPNPHEREWLSKLKPSQLPTEIHGLIEENDSHHDAILRKLISKQDFTKQQADEAFELIFSNDTPDYYKGAFLEGMRLKRETREENLAFYGQLKKQITPEHIETKILIDIADSYDGNVRHFPMSLFTACVLASCGLPTLLHGVQSVAPKHGVTAHQILYAAGKKPLKTKSQVVEDLTSGPLWSYLDQSQFHPELTALLTVRHEMIKRPFLATYEKLLQPIQSVNDNLLVTSFTHGHYKKEVIETIAELGDCNLALSIKGIEGTCMPNLSRQIPLMTLQNGEIKEEGYEYIGTCKDSPPRHGLIRPTDVLSAGLSVLNGQENYYRHQVIAQATYIHSYATQYSADQSQNLVTEAIDSGKALETWYLLA